MFAIVKETRQSFLTRVAAMLKMLFVPVRGVGWWSSEGRSGKEGQASLSGNLSFFVSVFAAKVAVVPKGRSTIASFKMPRSSFVFRFNHVALTMLRNPSHSSITKS